jgi:hypothetical protein
MMLPLNSHRWRTLETFCHAPGVPGGVEARDLLKRWRDAIGTSDAKRLYHQLRDYFTQQYSIKDAAYAVIPYIVKELERLPPTERIRCLIDLGVTELATVNPYQPGLPDDLEDDYLAAIEKAKRIAERCLTLELSKEEFRYLIAVICILRGHEGLGDLLVHLHGIAGECPRCGETVFPKEIRDSGYLGD